VLWLQLAIVTSLLNLPPLAGFASLGKDLDRSNGLINFTFDQLRLYQKRQEGTNTCHIKASLITVINLSTGTFGTYIRLVAQKSHVFVDIKKITVPQRCVDILAIRNLGRVSSTGSGCTNDVHVLHFVTKTA
jgi:hypothetical protein